MEKLIEVLELAKPQADMEELLASKDLYGQGLIDSLEIICIVEEINAAFGIELGARDITRKDFLTVESIFELIKRHGGA